MYGGAYERHNNASSRLRAAIPKRQMSFAASRRMHAVLGKSPLSYFQSLRVERAVHLLKTGNESVDQIAERVGYADGVTLRTLLRRHLGYGIREIRRAN